MKQAYTRVLKGNLEVERLHFPANQRYSGSHIDVLARKYLWECGLDYGHGTGHGVGYFLCVHEGPQGISRLAQEPLLPGMVVSNGKEGYIYNIKYT